MYKSATALLFRLARRRLAGEDWPLSVAASRAMAAKTMVELSDNAPSDKQHQQTNGSTSIQSAKEAYDVPLLSTPIRADVREFDFASFGQANQFDVILMDPPWQLAGQAPSRGVSLSYSQLPDAQIGEMPVPLLQKESGLVFIWVINNKYQAALDIMYRWGYALVFDIAWVKRTVNRRLAKCHGYYLQHAKETCLVGKKGAITMVHADGILSDVIYAERRGQSRKPDELYEMIEALVPGGRYLEIFGRKHNLRDHWTTIGNEL